MDWKIKVSIHLMLQFILCCRLAHLQNTCFNTSHVVVYPIAAARDELAAMFQYISCCSLSTESCIASSEKIMFQYISCCSLSPHSDRSAKPYQCFNTSHVVVYQEVYCLFHCISRFQYISCCSLSTIKGQIQSQCYKFQYISCCSLSCTQLPDGMEIVLFQYISCCSLSRKTPKKYNV